MYEVSPYSPGILFEGTFRTRVLWVEAKQSMGFSQAQEERVRVQSRLNSCNLWRIIPESREIKKSRATLLDGGFHQILIPECGYNECSCQILCLYPNTKPSHPYSKLWDISSFSTGLIRYPI